MNRSPLILMAVTVLAAGIAGWSGAATATPRMPGGGSCDQKVAAFIAAPPAVIDSLGLTNAWAYSRGTGITVAVVDSGVTEANPHLGSVVLPGTTLVGTTDNRADIGGLGTAIAGLIAAQPVEGSGLTGVAPGARILPVRVYDKAEGQTPSPDGPQPPAPAVTAQGVIWAADHGAAIIVVPTPFTVDDAALRQAVTYARNKGALTIAPVGDAANTTGSDGTVWYPAAYSDVVLGVTAVDAAGAPTDATVRNASVQLAAPGANAVSTFYALGDCLFTGSTPSSVFAAGYAAGLAALVAARFPQEQPADWAYRLLATASRPLAAQRDDALGWGVIDPTAALTFVNDGTALGPANPRYPPPTPAPVPPGMRGRVAAPGPGDLDRRALAGAAALAVIVALMAPLVARRRQRPTSSTPRPVRPSGEGLS